MTSFSLIWFKLFLFIDITGKPAEIYLLLVPIQDLRGFMEKSCFNRIASLLEISMFHFSQ